MKNIKYIVPVVIVMIIAGVLMYIIPSCGIDRTQSMDCRVGFSNVSGKSESGYYVASLEENVDQFLEVKDTWTVWGWKWDSKGEVSISAKANYDYYVSLKSFNISLKNGIFFVDFLPLTAKASYSGLQEHRKRGLSANNALIDDAKNEFLKPGGEFEKRLEKNANSENRIRMAKTYAEDSLKSLLQELIFPLLKIKNVPSEKIIIRYNAELANGKINVTLPGSSLIEYEGNRDLD